MSQEPRLKTMVIDAEEKRMGAFGKAQKLAERMGALFPIFFVSEETVLMQAAAALIVGVVAAALPAWRTAHVKIVDGLRAVA